MAKFKGSKGGHSVTQKHLHARISYLFQASNYFSTISHHQEQPLREKDGPVKYDGSNFSNVTQHYSTKIRSEKKETPTKTSRALSFPNSKASSNLSCQMASHMRAVSLKSQIRLSSNVKRLVCRRCDNLLMPGELSTERLENLSKNGAKPWADVLVLTCNSCGTEKRYPVGAKRQPRKAVRNGQKAEAIHTD